MMKQIKQEFCMQQFKPAIAVMAILVVIIIGWTLWRQCPGSFVRPDAFRGSSAAAAAALKPQARNIDVNAKPNHPYLGVCNQCHITTGIGQQKLKAISGRPISIKQKMPHQYWGNCMLCHAVKDGWQTGGQFITPGETLPNQQQAQAAGLVWLTGASLGLTVRPVNETMLTQLKLAKHDGLLVIAVAPGSLGDKAGLLQGDEIVRVNKTTISRVEQLEAALNQAKGGTDIAFVVFRGKDCRKLHAKLPKDLADLVVSEVPQTQMQSMSALPQAATSIVVVAAIGRDLTAPVAAQFETAPYFVIIDQTRRSYRVEANPNAGRIGLEAQAVQLMANLNVDGIIAGGFNQSTLENLASLGIAGYPGVIGSIQEAFAAYQTGRLLPIQAPPGSKQAVNRLNESAIMPQAVRNHNLPQTLF